MKIIQALAFSILILLSVADRQRVRAFSIKELIIRIKFCQAKVKHYSIQTSIILE